MRVIYEEHLTENELKMFLYGDKEVKNLPTYGRQTVCWENKNFEAQWNKQGKSIILRMTPAEEEEDQDEKNPYIQNVEMSVSLYEALKKKGIKRLKEAEMLSRSILVEDYRFRVKRTKQLEKIMESHGLKLKD